MSESQTLYLDIETIGLPQEQVGWAKPTKNSVSYGNIKDPAKKDAKYKEVVAKWRDRLALSPMTGKVVCIGWARGDGEIDAFRGENEAPLLTAFWNMVGSESTCIVGYNVAAFDLPYLIRRSWLCGVHHPQMQVWHRECQQYRSNVIIDLMDMWACGTKEMVKQDILAAAFGIKGNAMGMTGADFGKVWEEDRDRAVLYCQEDVRMLRELAGRLKV